MRYHLAAVASLAALIGCTPEPVQRVGGVSLLNPDLKSPKWPADVSQQLKSAVEDYDAVIAGRLPIHARPTVTAADGGTTEYVGDGYRLTVIKSLSTLAGVHGCLYGPVIRFNSDLPETQLPTELSHVTFYSSEELQKLLHPD